MPVSFPERFNMADYFLYHNVEEGRENKVCLYYEDRELDLRRGRASFEPDGKRVARSLVGHRGPCAAGAARLSGVCLDVVWSGANRCGDHDGEPAAAGGGLRILPRLHTRARRRYSSIRVGQFLLKQRAMRDT